MLVSLMILGHNVFAGDNSKALFDWELDVMKGKRTLYSD